MDLFVRESGPVGAPAIVFLHGGEYSGRSWMPVAERMEQYRCLVPDLPQHGQSFQRGPFEIDGAAVAVAELIRSRVGTEKVHLVGLSLGAQVGAQLLAIAPRLIDRAVLCGAIVDSMPAIRVTAPLLGVVAWISRSVTMRKNARPVGVSSTKIDDHREDVRLMPPAQIAHVVEASAAFKIPDALNESDSATLFLTGSQEMRLIRRSAEALAERMPNGVNGVAMGMDHEWPLRDPDLFARTLDCWFSAKTLPPEIALPNTSDR